MKRCYRIFSVLWVTLAFVGCASPARNQQEKSFQENSGYRFDQLATNGNSDALFICLSFSGGGTRAAALAYGVMEELKRVRIVVNGTEKSLLDEVDCISSVSGGSFTAAYYGLFGERLFSNFRERFLYRNIQGELIRRLFNPVNWFRLASPTFGRSDLAAELYDKEIFDHRRVADLQHRGRPLVIFNATNLESGARFSFLPEYFDAMGSNLASYPVAWAVAASSAFPVLLSPLTLVNYSLPEDYEPPWWYEGAADSLHVARYRYQAGQDLAYYLDKKNRYVHLMDGGLADNIGARALYYEFARGFIRKRINDGRIKRLVVIVVNARTESQAGLSDRQSPPGLGTVALKTATISMENYSYESISLMVESLARRVQAQKNIEACDKVLKRNCPAAPAVPPLAGAVDPYVIEINFAGAAMLQNENPNDYLSLPTSFKLGKEQIEKLIAIGPKLLQASPQFRCLTRVLAAEAEDKPRPTDCPVGAGISGFN